MVVQKTLQFHRHQTPQEVLERLHGLALTCVNRRQRILRIVLTFHSRGQRCRLFCGHGPWGTVIERTRNSDSQDVTVCEFDSYEVLDDVARRLKVDHQ